MQTRIGFVGVGRMGANMARRLHEQGFPVAALYDVLSEAAKTLSQELGCPAVQRLTEVTAASDVVITVVSDDWAMEKIFSSRRGRDSLLVGAEGKLFINCATVSPAAQVQAARAAAKAGANSLEACMAGSITHARGGTLFLMCGGDAEVFERARPILEKLGSKVRLIGPTGQAARLKLLVNMVMNINTAALAEGLGLAEALKLDLTLVREVFAETGAASRVLQTDGEDMQNREHSCFFSAEHAAKDSGLALDLATAANLDLPLARATKKQYDRMVKKGLGALDKSGISELTFKRRAPRKSKL